MDSSLKSNNKQLLNIFRQYPEYDNHQMLICISDNKSGLTAYIAIHNTSRGPALGGTRIQSYASAEEAVQDVLNLSKAMSYKCALSNLPYGGGKGVIVIPSAGVTKDMLKAYAMAVDELRGLFKTGTDVGVSESDVAYMGKYTQHMLGLTSADRGELSTSSCAALGVYHSIRAGLEFMYGDASPKNRIIAIKGVGKLGGELVSLLSQDEARLIITDTDDKTLQKVSKKHPGIRCVSPDQIHKEQADIYSPCALGNEFTDKILSELACKAVIGGANNQLPNTSAGQKLFDMGILYAPDYVANAGGLIYVSDELENDGFNKTRVINRIAEIQTTMTDIFMRSKENAIPTHAIADSIALERIAETNNGK